MARAQLSTFRYPPTPLMMAPVPLMRNFCTPDGVDSPQGSQRFTPILCCLCEARLGEQCEQGLPLTKLPPRICATVGERGLGRVGGACVSHQSEVRAGLASAPSSSLLLLGVCLGI